MMETNNAKIDSLAATAYLAWTQNQRASALDLILAQEKPVAAALCALLMVRLDANSHDSSDFAASVAERAAPIASDPPPTNETLVLGRLAQKVGGREALRIMMEFAERPNRTLPCV